MRGASVASCKCRGIPSSCVLLPVIVRVGLESGGRELPYWGIGSRLCPGQKLATVQLCSMFLVLAMRAPSMELRADCTHVKSDYKPTPVPVEPAGCWIRYT